MLSVEKDLMTCHDVITTTTSDEKRQKKNRATFGGGGAAPAAPIRGAAPPLTPPLVPENTGENKDRNRRLVWFLTIFKDLESVATYLETYSQHCEWLAYVHELAPTTERPHIHCGFKLKERKRWSELTKDFSDYTPDIRYQEKGVGPDGILKYLEKTGEEIHKFGKFPEKKKVTPMIERCAKAIQLAKDNKLDEVDSDLLLRHYSTLRKMLMRFTPERDLEWDDKDMQRHFFWIYGPTGTGKSHLARMLAKRLDMPITLKSINKWWDDYRPGSLVVIDEADPDRCKYLAGFFKQWFDKWTFKPEVKGDHALEIRPQWMLVTSNYSIEECFPQASDYEPLRRRIREIYLPGRDDGILDRILEGPAEDENGPGHTRADNIKGASGPCTVLQVVEEVDESNSNLNSNSLPEEPETRPMTPNPVLDDWVMDPQEPVFALTDDTVTDEVVEIRTEKRKREEEKEDARSYFKKRLSEITCPWENKK